MPDLLRCSCGCTWWKEGHAIQMTPDHAIHNVPTFHASPSVRSRTTYTCDECGLDVRTALEKP